VLFVRLLAVAPFTGEFGAAVVVAIVLVVHIAGVRCG
jgi:hypothetical protein